MNPDYRIVATFTDLNSGESPHENNVPFYHIIRIDPNDELNYEIVETFNTLEEAKIKYKDLTGKSADEA